MKFVVDEEKYMLLLADIASLKEKPLPEVRETIAEKVSAYFSNGLLNSAEGEIACDIIRMLANDVETRVRRTLANQLKNDKKLPRDIALKLANDVLEVAQPILEFSTVLTDTDLISIIQSTKQVAKLVAISKRNSLSEMISGELVKSGSDEVVVSLFLNSTARISQGSFEYAFHEFKDSSKVVGALIGRGGLSVGVVEKILNAVTAKVREELVNSNEISKERALMIARISQERAKIDLLNEASRQANSKSNIDALSHEISHNVLQAENVVNQLLREDRLTNSIILRSICEGNMLFFEISMARRAGIPVMNARALINDGNPAALRSLWKRARMPESSFEAVSIIINFSKDFSKYHPENTYGYKLIEYIQEKDYEKTIHLMPYMMTLVASKVRVADVIHVS